MELSPQNNFGLSHAQRLVRRKALRELPSHFIPPPSALPVSPVFEDDKLKGSGEKSVKRKLALKRPQDYNSYLVREKLITPNWRLKIDSKPVLGLVTKKSRKIILDMRKNSCGQKRLRINLLFQLNERRYDNYFC